MWRLMSGEAERDNLQSRAHDPFLQGLEWCHVVSFLLVSQGQKSHTILAQNTRPKSTILLFTKIYTKLRQIF